jgi:hypothetical protein
MVRQNADIEYNLKRFDIKKIKKDSIVVILGKRNSGKSVCQGTKVITSDGKIKLIENIKVGDYLMGDDSKPRLVLGTHSGNDMMYKITNKRGDEYTVNSFHILTLFNISKNTVIDIPIMEYLELDKDEQKNLHGFQVKLEFKEIYLEIPAYNLGRVIKNDIPHKYKCNSRENRLELLAGLIDTYGTIKEDHIEIITENLNEDIQFIARSLGFITQIINNAIKIRGNMCEIPTQIIKYNFKKSFEELHSEIEIKEIGMGKYYGVELNENHRYVLGNFIVTHNSFLLKDIMYNQRSIQIGTVISETDFVNHFYDKFIPGMLIHKEYKSTILEKVFARQEKALNEGWADPYAFLIMDDCLADARNWVKDKKIKDIFYNGRHFKLFSAFCMQSPMGLPPAFRTNIDFTFILKNNNRADRKRIYENYAGCFESQEIFEIVLDNCTEDYNCLVIDNTTQSNRIEDQVFYYKAGHHDDFKLCSNRLWTINRDNFKTSSYNTNKYSSCVVPSRKGNVIIKKKK